MTIKSSDPAGARGQLAPNDIAGEGDGEADEERSIECHTGYLSGPKIGNCVKSEMTLEILRKFHPLPPFTTLNDRIGHRPAQRST